MSTNGVTTLLSGATLDVNGQNLDSEPVVVGGSGVGGLGALINAGTDQNSALKNVTLTSDTYMRADATFGIRTLADTDPGFQGNGYKLTKIGSNQLNLNGGQTNPGITIWESDLGDIDVLAGTLSFQRRMTMGRQTNRVSSRIRAPPPLGAPAPLPARPNGRKCRQGCRRSPVPVDGRGQCADAP